MVSVFVFGGSCCVIISVPRCYRCAADVSGGSVDSRWYQCVLLVVAAVAAAAAAEVWYLMAA